MLYLGVDIGGSNIAAAIVDDAMNIIGRGKVKFVTGRPFGQFCDDIAAASQMAADDAGVKLSDCAYCGMGCPGAVNSRSGMLEYSSNLGFEKVSLGAEMGRRLGLSIYIDNDANCAALGEVKAGAAKGAESALVVTLGTGIGGGIVIGGKIYSGVNGIAGEIGHMTIIPGGEECACGRRGCWEAYASATALKRQTRRAMEAEPDSLMWKYAPQLDKVSGKTPFQAMRDGDSTATLVVESYIYYLSLGLINCINILQPEVICIGGGVSNEGDQLLEPLRKHVEKNSFCIGNIRQPRIELAKLWGDAGLIGAAMLDAK